MFPPIKTLEFGEVLSYHYLQTSKDRSDDLYLPLLAWVQAECLLGWGGFTLSLVVSPGRGAQ